MRAFAPPPAERNWAYFLDVDGTLIPIADTPNAVTVDALLTGLLARLHEESGGALALVSGRAIADLDKRLGMLCLPLSGQHGLEWRDAKGRTCSHAVAPVGTERALQALSTIVARHPGLVLEDKGLTLALHYRLAPHLASYAHRVMAQFARDSGGRLGMQRGKCVAEIKPAGVDKGTAVAAYLAEPPFRGRRPVFIGDDVNDEAGFAEVNRQGGISIKVGKGRSCARFRLRDVAAVRAWLTGTREVSQS